MIKTLSKLGIEGNFLNTTKGIHEKPTLTAYTSIIKDKAFTPRLAAFTTAFQHCTRHSNYARKIKGTQIRKEKSKVYLQMT